MLSLLMGLWFESPLFPFAAVLGLIAALVSSFLWRWRGALWSAVAGALLCLVVSLLFGFGEPATLGEALLVVLICVLPFALAWLTGVSVGWTFRMLLPKRLRW